MIEYIARRLLFFIPTLVAISLLAFVISINAPGDPVERMISSPSGDGISAQNISQIEQQNYWRNKLGLDLPAFYISVTPWNETAEKSLKSYIPIIKFHSNNQYHRWIFGDGNWLTGNGSVHSKGIIRGDFGISYQTRQPVSQVITEKVGWSLFFALCSVLLAYLVSVPIGIVAGAKRDSGFDRVSSVVLFIFYSMPSFWVATLLLMTFANPDVLHWFPASGVKPATGYPDDAGIFTQIKLSLPYIILPLICYTYSSFAFLSRATRVSILDSMTQDYIRTARAKGLSNKIVIFRHAFRNSLLPLITIFANVFPMAIGGAVILETIFTIPGMGYETVQSIQNQNYPMIVAIFTITGLLTVIGYLVSDILYAVADPRITFSNKRS